MDNIIRELKFAYRKIANTPSISDRDYRLQTLNRVEEFILEYDWGTSKNIRDFIKYFRLSNREVSRLTNQSENNVRLIRKRVSDRIRATLGENRIEKVVNGSREDINRVNYCINILMKGVSSEYCTLDFVSRKVSQDRYVNNYLLEELTDELDFLRKYSKQKLISEIEKLSKEKLAYILRVLNCDGGYLLDDKIEFLIQILKNEESK